MSEKGQPLPKFGDWDVNDPTSAEGFTMIFNKARDEKKTGGKPDSPAKEDSSFKHGADLGKPQSVSCNPDLCLFYYFSLLEGSCRIIVSLSVSHSRYHALMPGEKRLVFS